MMPDPVRVGVIGTSWYADLVHLPNLKSHPRAQLAAICGRTLARAQELAHKYDIPAVYTDYRAMVEQGHLDAVVIAAPDDLHYVMTMTALEAGLHVNCEKPLALTADQARDMATKAAAAGLKHMTFFSYRWFAHYRYLHQLVSEGYIGQPYLCQFRHLGGYGRADQYEWRFDDGRSNGILGDLGSHLIDLARWLVGDITKVCATLTTFIERVGPSGKAMTPANDSALLLLEFDNGARGTIVTSAMAHLGERGHHHHHHLVGEAGTLEAEFSFVGSQIQGVRYDQAQFEPLPIPDEYMAGMDPAQPFFDQIVAAFRHQSIGNRHFIDAILADQPISPNFDDGLKVQEVIDAALESHRHGCWVPVGANDKQKERAI